MNKIYRIEHKDDGFGPYHNASNGLFTAKTRPGIFDIYNGRLVHQGKKHPSLIEDEGIQRMPEEDEVCGFASKRDIINWFTPFEIRGLIKLGYRIKIYYPSKVVYGRKQYLFVR